MKLKSLVIALVAAAALLSAGLAGAQAAPPKLEIGPSVVKVKNGKLVLVAKCIGDAECQSVLTARIDVRNGGLGGQIFDVDPGKTEKLVFKLEPNVRMWLKTHRRSTLVISARTSNEEYQVVWRGTFKLTLLA
jgi:hypothetical protein